MSASFDIVLVFVLSVYMLLYGQRIGALVRRVMPPGDGDALRTTIRASCSAPSPATSAGSCCSASSWAPSAGVALYMFGVLGIFPDGEKYALAFAIFYGVMELVPYIGPILGALPPMLVALFTEPITALWVALLFIGLQQLEGHVVAPQMFGHTLRINPLLVIFALLLGLQLYGIVGALVALPILSVLRETAVYLRRHLSFEPWDRARRRTAVSAAARTADPQRPGHRQALRRARGAARGQLRCRRGGAGGGAWARTAPARRRCCRSSPASRGRARAASSRGPAEVGLGAPAARAVFEAVGAREPAACSRVWRGSRIPSVAVARMLEQTGLRERADDRVDRLSGGNRQRVNVALGLIAEPPVLALDEPSASLDPGQRERAVGASSAALAASGTSVLFSTHHVGEVQRYATRAIVLADGELLFDGPPRELIARGRATARTTSRRRSSRFLGERGHGDGARGFGLAMRWLLNKDLLILRRSRLLVACSSSIRWRIALLIGLAISRSPPSRGSRSSTKPRRARRSRWAASASR